MRSTLEQGIAALLNEDASKAEELFHKFMVQRAREIFESMNTDSDEDWDNADLTERYFTEADLDDLEDVDDSDDSEMSDAEDNLSDDLDVDDSDFADDTMDADTDFDDSGNAPEDLDDLVDRMDDLEDHFAELSAKYEELVGDKDSDVDTTDDLSDKDFDDNDMSPDGENFDDDASNDSEENADFDDNDMPSDDEDEYKDDEYDDITESVIRELDAISFTPSAAKSVGVSKDMSQNNTSPLSKKVGNEGRPVKVTSKNHSGYGRETAPTVKEIGLTPKNAKKPLGAVNKDPKTELNKFGDDNKKSPVLKVKK